MARALPQFAALLFACTLAAGAHAHLATGDRVPEPATPSRWAGDEELTGTIDALPVRDRRTGATLTYYSLRQADGTRVALKWLPHAQARTGAQVQLGGRRSGDVVFVDRGTTLRDPLPDFADGLPADASRVTGTLEFLHADDFERRTCVLVFSLIDEAGTHVPLRFPVVPDVLERGMRLAVDAVPAGDGVSVEARAVEILPAAADQRLPPEQLISGTTQVLVILIKYSDTTADPYTQAGIDTTVFSGTGSVANYYREASYGKHQLAGTVTPWLTARFAKPATCDYSKVASEAMVLAGQAGYTTANYQKYVYVFPSLPGCGWAGLGGGSQAWINQAANLLVIGHELGHTFGLGHASSLDCGALAIGGTCTRSEYGDPFEIMGNQKGAHFNAIHKDELGYFGTGQVRTHPGGTALYVLSPLESAGGTTYAVKVPGSAKRTYWLEWRQPLGFDASLGTGATNGALVHIGYPSDYGCDTCLVDMTPATSSFGDAALPTGQSFTDTETGTAISVTAQVPGALSVWVTTPTRPTFADVPSTHFGYAAIEALAWNAVTRGCAANPARFCPDNPVTRAEMAVFVERAKRGGGFAFAGTGTTFADVPATHWAVGHIEQFYTDGITTGCASSPLRFCPDGLVTRAEMAPFLLKARYGSTFNAGTATGTVFSDVPSTHWAGAWIEKLYQYGISLGCASNPRRYCPDAQVTRAEMALFLQRTFSLVGPPN